MRFPKIRGPFKEGYMGYIGVYRYIGVYVFICMYI